MDSLCTSKIVSYEINKPVLAPDVVSWRKLVPAAMNKSELALALSASISPG